jgi:hypothetical protein
MVSKKSERQVNPKYRNCNYDDDFINASNPPPGNEPVETGLPEGVGVDGLEGNMGLTSAASLLRGGLLNTGSGPQKSEAGAAGGGCVVPPGVFLSGTEPCFLGAAPAPRLDEGRGEPGWKLSSGRLKLISGRGPEASPVGAVNKGPAMELKGLEPATDFCGVLTSRGGGGAKAALWLRIGSLRTFRRAFFSLWADLSAFRAAAVVTATLGVTIILPLRRSGSRASRGEEVSKDPSLSFTTCPDNLAISSACCCIAMSMLRYVLLMTSRVGALSKFHQR